MFIKSTWKMTKNLLAGMSQWTECQPANQRVAGSIPSQGNAWVAGQVPSWGRARGNHTDVSLPFFLPSFLFLWK